MSDIIVLKSNMASGQADIQKLTAEIENLNLQKTIINILDLQHEVVCIFEQELTEQEIISIRTTVQNHVHFEAIDQIKIIVQNAINFGSNLIIEFASENIAMGITQAGKTKKVSDYLANVTRYAQTGSLYEVINELDRLMLEGLPQELEPFVTEIRLNTFKQKIEEYLGE